VLVPGHYTFYDFIEYLSSGMLTIMAAGLYGALNDIILRTIREALRPRDL
jgi:hypothetical protein